MELVKEAEMFNEDTHGCIKVVDVLDHPNEKAKLLYLHRSIAESYLNVRNFKAAFEYATSCIEIDAQSSQGYILLGRTNRYMDKHFDALDAFGHAASLLGDGEQNKREGIVTHLCESYANHVNTGICRIPVKGVATLSIGVKCSIIFRLIKEQQWTAALTFFEEYILDSVYSNITGENIDLNPVCDISMLSSHAWLAEFIKKMVLRDHVDFRKIKLEPDESYLHSSVRIAFATGNVGLLALVTEKAKCCQEQNQRDRHGNTALHMAAQFPPENEMLIEVSRILLENEVDPFLENKDGKTAKDLASPKHQKLIGLLEHDEKTNKGYQPQTKKKNHRRRKRSLGCKRKQNSGFKRSALADGNEHPEIVVEEIPTDESPEKCSCRTIVEEIRTAKLRKDCTIETLVHVLQETHRSHDHHKVRNECLVLIADIISQRDTSDIPCVLTRVAKDVYIDILHELIQLRQWELMCKAVELYREKVDGNALSEFVSDMSIVNMIQTVQTTNEEKIVEILKFMLDGGANLKREEEHLVNAVLKRSQYKVLEALLRHDINPELLTVYPGDTPIHAALFIGLQLDKGNFTIFELFIERYWKNSKNQSCLNPYQEDESGNGLFHIVAKGPDCLSNHRATHILNRIGLPLSQRNKKGLLPKDCLVCKHKDIEQIYSNLKEEGDDQLKERIFAMINSFRKETSLPATPNPITHRDASSEKPACVNLSPTGKSHENGNQQAINTKIDFDPTLIEDLIWEIQCTKDFLKALKNRKVHPHLRKKAVQSILELGRGFRMKHLSKRLTHNNPSGPVLYEIKLDKAVRIIWEKAIDLSCRRQDETRCYSEVIRLWDLVLDHDKIYSSVQNIIRSYERATTSPNLTKCIKGKPQNELHYETPQIFTYDDRKTQEGNVDTHYSHHPVNPDPHEFNVMKFYFFSSDVVYNILESSEIEVDFQFKVTDHEYSFINMKTDTPILLLGRSGTGKTTCCLYRLWNKFEIYWTEIERMHSAGAYSMKPIRNGKKESTKTKCTEVEEIGSLDLQIHIDEERIADTNKQNHKPKNQDNMSGETEDYLDRHLRQIFVTKNPMLCMEVERNFHELRHASRVGKKHSFFENKPCPLKLQDVDDLLYPLFITFRKLLQILDNSIVDANLSMRFDKAILMNDIEGWSDFDNVDDMSKLRDGSPGPIELSDDEVSDDSSDDDSTVMVHREPKTERKQDKSTSQKIMTYGSFVNEAWKKIRKEDSLYHPSLVWTEIVSFIKGSYEALNSPNGYLNLEEYERLGRKMAPMFTGDRKKIYEIFLKYEHFKKQNCFIDEADVTRAIYDKLTKQRDPNLLVHEVYVDETQDFTQAELCILIQLCRNPNGIFMTGDTAQCIMHGISFRFEDLRTMFYSMFRKQSIGKSYIPPKIYHLPHNYRSHAGILNLASSVLELVKEFFPESYDHLEKDSGMLDGPKPVLLLEKHLRDLRILLNTNQRNTSHIELGAHQAILVMNEMTKQRAETVFSKCLVITIDRAKGLEFDDVLLFNFFKESHAKKEWRTVLGYQQKVAVTDTSVDTGRTDRNTNDARALEFDQRKHKVLNTELKLLYTAITRARTNVWIFDEDDESRAPMFEYFQKRGLVETTVNDFTRRSFTKSSSPAEWMAEGHYLYIHHRFHEAAVCYENGRNPKMAEYCRARHSEQQAEFSSVIPSLGVRTPIRMGLVLTCRRKLSPVTTWNKGINQSNWDVQSHSPVTGYTVAVATTPSSNNPFFTLLTTAIFEGDLKVSDFLPHVDESKIRHHLLSAILGYLKCNRIRRTLSCLKKLGDYEILAKLYERINKMKKATTIYKDLKRPIDQSRCLEQLGYYGKAMQVLAESTHFEECLGCLKRYWSHKNSKDAIPKSLNSDFNINYTAAKYYGSIRNKDCMMKYCKKITDEKKMDIFMSCDFIEEAANLLHEKGRHNEAMELYIKNGNVQKALQHLKQKTIKNRELWHACTIIRAQLAVVISGKEGIDESVQDLDEIINDKSANTLLAAKAQFIRGQLQEDRDDIKKAYGMFATGNASYFGKLECINWLVENMRLTDYFEDACTILTYLGELHPPFHHLVFGKCSRDYFQDSDYMFYGIKYEEVSKNYKIYPRQAPLARKICTSKNNLEICLGKEEMTESVLHFITQRANQWLQKLQSSIELQKNSMEQFLQNPKRVNKPESLEHLTKVKELKKESLFCLIQSHILSVGISFLSKWTTDPTFDECEAFSSTLFSFNCIQAIPVDSMDLKSKVSNLLRKSPLEVFRKAMVKYLKANFNQLLKASEKSTMRNFIEIILLQNGLALTDVNVLEMMGNYEHQRLTANERPKTFSTNKDRGNAFQKITEDEKSHGCIRLGNSTFISIAKQFSETIKYLNINDANSAAYFFNAFCKSLGEQNQEGFEISFDVFLLCAESILSITLLNAVQVDNDIKVIIPNSFRRRLYYVETVFLNNSTPCVSDHTADQISQKATSEFCLKHFVHVLCGLSCNVNLLQLARKKDWSSCENASERIIVLSLLILCNLGGAIKLNDTEIKKLASEVDHTLTITNKEDVLKQIKSSESSLDFINALAFILEKQDMHLQVCTWNAKMVFRRLR